MSLSTGDRISLLLFHRKPARRQAPLRPSDDERFEAAEKGPASRHVRGTGLFVLKAVRGCMSASGLYFCFDFGGSTPDCRQRQNCGPRFGDCIFRRRSLLHTNVLLDSVSLPPTTNATHWSHVPFISHCERVLTTLRSAQSAIVGTRSGISTPSSKIHRCSNHIAMLSILL